MSMPRHRGAGVGIRISIRIRTGLSGIGGTALQVFIVWQCFEGSCFGVLATLLNYGFHGRSIIGKLDCQLLTYLHSMGRFDFLKFLVETLD